MKENTCSIILVDNPHKQCEQPLPPETNLSKDRKASILSDTPAIFNIENNPTTNPNYGVWRAIKKFGYSEINENNILIELEANNQGVDPNLVKAIVYVEASHGGYGYIAESLDIADSIYPMNIRASIWGNILTEEEKGGKSNQEAFKVPELNIRAGVRLIKRIQERVPNPTIEKIATLYNNLATEGVTDYGARVADVYTKQLWLQHQCADRLYFTPPDDSHLLPDDQDKRKAMELLLGGDPSLESPFLKTNDCTDITSEKTYDFYYNGTDSLSINLANNIGGSVVFLSTRDDYVISNGGRNIIDGKEGIDTISYENAQEGVEGDLLAGSVLVGHQLASDGAVKNIDTLDHIENLIGSPHNDILTANKNTIFLEGGKGNDLLNDFEQNHSTQYRFNQGDGHDIIDDSDRQGEIWYNGSPISGTAKMDTTNQGQWTLDRFDVSFVLTKQNNDLTITMDETATNPSNSITVKNFDFINGQMGIRTPVNNLFPVECSTDIRTKALEVARTYLYGSNTIPYDFSDDTLIRPYPSNSSVCVDLPRFMSEGAGRFALGSQFDIVRRFIAPGDFELGGNNLSPGNYNISTLAQHFSLRSYYGLVLDQKQYPGNDYIERVFIYNTGRFKVSDGAQFIVANNASLTRYINNFSIEPDPNFAENVDLVWELPCCVRLGEHPIHISFATRSYL